MTTPNIEELIAVLEATNQFHDNADICTADVIVALQTQAERIKELEAEIITRASYGDEQTDFAIKLAAERDALRAQLAEIEMEEPDIYVHQDGLQVWEAKNNAALENDPNSTAYFTRPMPAQPIIGLQAIHDAITVDQTLAQPNIQNQIVKDISEKPCHTCAHYEQGKRPCGSIYEETCYECSEYYGSRWEAA